MSMENTKINYLYRDGSNYKVYNSVVVAGKMTEDMEDQIMEALNDATWFIPAKVGLPANRFETFTEDDHYWFEWDGFWITDALPTFPLTVTELVEAFVKCKDSWEEGIDKFGNLVVCEKEPLLSNNRLETLLYNAISLLEDYGCDGVQLEKELGITAEEYDAIMEIDATELTNDSEYKSYRFTVDYKEKGKQKSFQIGISAKEKPDNVWLAQKISNYFSAHYNDSVDKAIKSVESIDVLITDSHGEYVDSDEIYGDDLKDLFEHLKKDKPGLDVVISSAENKAKTGHGNEPVQIDIER